MQILKTDDMVQMQHFNYEVECMVEEEKTVYRIDAETFLQAWYNAITATPPLSMADFIPKLRAKCDADPRNANALPRKWSESAMSQKMDYYRRSYELDINKPTMTKKDTKDARAERKTKFKDMFLKAKVATKRESK